MNNYNNTDVIINIILAGKNIFHLANKTYCFTLFNYIKIKHAKSNYEHIFKARSQTTTPRRRKERCRSDSHVGTVYQLRLRSPCTK